MTLGGVFKLLQEAAIKHADLFNLGTKAMAARRESWVLSRIVARIFRYPRYEESVRVVTWSAGIRAFRGSRELRVYCGDELVVAASSLWIYLNLETKTVVRVPQELAAQFPERTEDIFRPEFERRKMKPLDAPMAQIEVSLRYSDFDGNGHLNNTVYFECVQTALMRSRCSVRPTEIDIQFLKEVLPAQRALSVALQLKDEAGKFTLRSEDGPHALGELKF
jgi:medium-chain acyl-[acyl-carrier-protein] hydrolase